jgi:pro-kumamolisin-like protein/Big-like domain-containing protein
MRNDTKSFSRTWLAVAISFVAPFLASAQTSNFAPRITSAIDENQLVTLKGNTHPLARPEFDRGAAPDGQPMRRMLLVLKRSAAQEAALDQLMEQQQDASSPNFHNWLTPSQFGQQFGPSDQDLQTITSWLQSHGFQVARVSSGRTVIEFSGTAGQVQEAFHTAIHKYNVNGEEHWANSSDPQIPMALTPVVAGVNTLHNFPRQQMHELAGAFTRTKATGAVKPSSTLFTFPNPCNPNSQPFCNFGVAPADFAKIYNVPNLLLSPAPATPFNGDGVTIAVVGQSDINTADIAQFRALFGLPALKAQQLNVIVSGPDPGVNGAETEADLDVQWVGAVAPNAAIDFVIAQDTEASLGVDLAAQYAIDNNVAPILNVSFGICEAALGTNGNLFFNQLWQQAAAQGITLTVSSGDSGSAVCNRGQGPATFGLAVSGFTSTPFNVSVGGTDFNDVNDFSTFWNTTPSDTPTVASAKSYIPEMTWNDTCTNQEIFAFFGTTTAEQTCNNIQAQNDGLLSVTGGSGGASNCTTGDGQDVTSCGGGYAKPSWQTALTPADGKRDVPDVSLFASNGFNSSFYIICESDVNVNETSCDPNAAETDFVGIGGTSASSPAFAGIMALVDQATGSRQGNANYILYKLAAQTGNTCTSAANPASTCVFYDVPIGSTIAMPCASGSPNCTVTTPGDQFGVLSGFATAKGYDLATGLGSVNAANLVSKWKNFALKSSSTALTLNSGTAVNIIHGQSVPVSIGVTGTGGTPTGNVSLVADTAPPTAPTEVTQQGVQGFTLTSGSVSSTTNVLPGSPNGQPYSVFARYAGDGTFKTSDSSPVSVTVAPEASQSTFAFELFNQATGLQTNSNATTAQYGSLELLRMNVTSKSGDTCAQNAPGQLGCPTGSVGVTNNGAALDAGTFALNSQGYAEDQIVQLPGGTNNLNVTYAGDNSFTGSSGTDTITINKAPTTTTMNQFFGNVILGSSADLSATIVSTGLGAAPGGQTTFFSGSTQLGSSVPVSGTAGSFTNLPSAQAGTSTSQLTLGANSVTVQYSGDGNYAGSTSSPITINVGIPTNTSITSSNLTIAHGSTVTFTATVAPTQSGGPGPTGTVSFNDGFSAVPDLGTVPLTNGQAQITTSTLRGGTLSISAAYSGDNDYFPSSNSLTETVTLLATTTTVMTSNPSAQKGANVTLTATVAPVQAGGPPLTGTVSFSYFNNLGDVFPVGTQTVSNGQAQVTTNTLPSNVVSVGANYSGDMNYAISSGMTAEMVHQTATTTVATSSNSTITQGSNVTFTATITPSQGGGPALTGTVQFTSNGTNVGSAANVSMNGANGQASVSTTTLSQGSDQIVAAYSGDSNYNGSTSSAITETVNAAPTFTVTANPTTIPVTAPGQMGSTTLTFTAMNGFSSNGAATVTPVYGGLPSETTCTPSFMVTIPSNGTTTAMISCQTTAPSSVIPASRNRPQIPGWRITAASAFALACLLCAAMLALGYSKRQRGWGLAPVFTIFAMLAASAGCGGGGGGGGGGGVKNPGTPAPSNTPITISITINGVTANVPNVTINVQ